MTALRTALMIVAALLALVGVTAFGIATATAQATCATYTLTPAGPVANIRERADINSKLIAQLQGGATVRAVALVGNWYTLAEQGGYIRADVVKAECVEATPTRIVATARAQATPIEQHIICPSACEITIIVEELP